MKKIGFIGAGNMALAISQGIIKNKMYTPGDMMVYDIDPEKRGFFGNLGMVIAQSEQEIAKNCHMVLLAVKPQIYETVLNRIKEICKGDNLFISIAAGISDDYIKKALGYAAKVVLVMPNTPLLLGFGASALSYAAPTTKEEFEMVRAVFAASGVAVEISPDRMREVVALNGSSPAFFYYIAQIFVERAVQQGFDADLANRLVCQTMLGSAQMMLQTEKDHQELIDMVSTKGGTTLAMRAAMDENGLRNALIAGMDACTKRAYELGQ